MKGISITDISTYNTFNHCAALNNVQTGVMMFGNFNQHNTFNNCTANDRGPVWARKGCFRKLRG